MCIGWEDVCVTAEVNVGSYHFARKVIHLLMHYFVPLLNYPLNPSDYMIHGTCWHKVVDVQRSILHESIHSFCHVVCTRPEQFARSTHASTPDFQASL